MKDLLQIRIDNNPDLKEALTNAIPEDRQEIYTSWVKENVTDVINNNINKAKDGNK